MENKKSHTKTTNLKHQLQRGMKNYPLNYILCQIFKIILSISCKNNTFTDNPPIKI